VEGKPGSPFLSFVVNSCTASNLIFGMISLMNSGRGCTRLAAWCLLAAVIMDAVDGFLARRWRVASEFGANLDSLADMTSFNIAGAVLTFYWFSGAGVPYYLMGLASLLYAVMGACRLARFNTAPKLSGEFQGVPTTGVAVIVAITHLTCPAINPWLGMSLVTLLSILMVSTFPYPKFDRMLKYPAWIWGAWLVVAYCNFLWTMWLSIGLYLLAGPLIWLSRKSQGDPPEWQVHNVVSS
jgi:CDP-diacylglycerol--serine O-phosphatidyltransferase